MPVIGIQTDLLARCLGATLGREELVEHLQHLGCDVEGYATLARFKCQRCGSIVETLASQDPPVACERCGVDYRQQPELRLAAGEVEVLRMELLAVRPDMFDPGGLARTLRSYLRLTHLPPRYEVASPCLRIAVDEAMLGAACPRGAIAGAVVRNLAFNDDLIKVIMKLQENLHWALGRDRKHAAIGVHDLARICTDRPLRYRPVGLDELRFVPLGYDPEDPAAGMTPREVLERHPKGVAFARLLAGWTLVPLLEDGEGRVLSMPPIINGERTRVTGQTRDLLIDVTGTDRRIVGKALNVLTTSLAELAPTVTLEAVTIDYPGAEVVTPDLMPTRVNLSVGETARLVGISLDDAATAELLERMGHEVRRFAEGMLSVAVPAYRNDVLHPRDLMEDVAIAYGYHRIPPRLDPAFTVGRAQPVEELAEVVRRSLTGLGLQETMTLQLTSPAMAFAALRRPEHDRFVAIENPISVDETMLRVSLIPGLLQTLQRNTGRELPQRIFEIGDITLLSAEAETGAQELRHVAGAVASATAGFAELRAIAEALLAELGWELQTRPSDSPTYLTGRGATLVARQAAQELVIGELGEVHPEVLESFHLRCPVSLFELELGQLLSR